MAYDVDIEMKNGYFVKRIADAWNIIISENIFLYWTYTVYGAGLFWTTTKNWARFYAHWRSESQNSKPYKSKSNHENDSIEGSAYFSTKLARPIRSSMRCVDERWLETCWRFFQLSPHSAENKTSAKNGTPLSNEWTHIALE